MYSPSLVADDSVTYRSPVDLVLSRDGQWLLTANQSSGSVSLVRLRDGVVVDEISCSETPTDHHPTDIALDPSHDRVYVVCQRSQQLVPIRFSAGRLSMETPIHIGLDPYGVALHPDGRFAYVSQAASASVAIVDLNKRKVVRKIDVGPWPRQICISADGKRVAVACNGNRRIGVIDTESQELAFEEPYGGINTGQLVAVGDLVYFPWMVYRQNPITAENIRRGWVLGSRIGRIRTDESVTREAITLDPRGKAVADPHGIGLTSDQNLLVASAGGTRELLLYRLAALEFESVGGPGDHINPNLLNRPDRFDRIELGGRPLNLQIDADDEHVYVVNYLLDAVQDIDLKKRQVNRTIYLHSKATVATSERVGEGIFYDGRRSLDQWYSCHSCHWEGGANSVTMDTTNDGTNHTFKTVLSLRNVTRTGPWTWHGWQNDLKAAMRKSLTETMKGPAPSDEDVQHLIQYLDQLKAPASPYREANQELSAAALRGQRLFTSARAGCAQCHQGDLLTDGEIHDVGLGSANDFYDGFNTPSLRGVYQKVRLLHNGRAKSFEQLLTRYHKPEELGDGPPLSQRELADLIAYLKSL